MKTIPLVIHVVYNTDKQNVSDAQIQSQIKVLNQDFSRTNPDAVQTPSAFVGTASNTGIQFCVVKIIRKKTSVTEFNDDNAVKFCHSDGSDSLDVTKYMNVWVCNLGGRLLGYGEFPNTRPSNTYGVVVNYGAFGTTGTARSPYNRGRTLTHEIAHSLNVHHIFEEGVPLTSCSKTDKCYDIPTQSKPNHGCPSFPKTDDCSLNPPGVMFMNFMDYVDDACMNIFTKDQSARMNAVLSIAPYNKLSLTGCAPNKDEITCNSPSTKRVSSLFTLRNIIIGVVIILLIVGIVIMRKKKII